MARTYLAEAVPRPQRWSFRDLLNSRGHIDVTPRLQKLLALNAPVRERERVQVRPGFCRHHIVGSST